MTMPATAGSPLPYRRFLAPNSQGRTRDEARASVIDALHGILELRFGQHALPDSAADSESLTLQLTA